jgi:hypothetical protein
MPIHKTKPHRDTEQAVAESAAGMIRIYGDDARAQANGLVARFAKLNDAEAEKTWRAIAQAIEKQLLRS